MAEKPTTLPQWATDGGRTLEPSAGKKGEGFVGGKKMPARWLNWVLNNAYTWFQYLDTPVGTGAGAGLAATGGTTHGPGLRGTGGVTNGRGVEGIGAGSGIGAHGTGGATGAGVHGVGGATSGHGVVGVATNGNSRGGDFTGQGSGAGVLGTGGATGSGVVGQGGGTNGSGVVGTGDGTGAGVKGFAEGESASSLGAEAEGVGGFFRGANGKSGVVGEGNGTTGNGGRFLGYNTSFYGVHATHASATGTAVLGAGGSGGIGISGTGSGTGSGVSGSGGFTTTGAAVRGVCSSTGRGVHAENSSTGVPLHLEPKSADPSTVSQGGAYVHSTTGGLNVYDGVTWRRHLAQRFASSAQQDRTSTGAFSNFSHTIPANSVRAGHTIRVRAWGRVAAYTSGTVTAKIRFATGPTELLITPAVTPTTSFRWYIDVTIVVEAAGAGGTLAGGGFATFGAAATDSPIYPNSYSGFAWDWTAASVIEVYTDISATATVRAEGMTVEVTG